MDALRDVPVSGACALDLDIACSAFGKDSLLVRWHQEYRLVDAPAGIKISIAAQDAQALISRPRLRETPSGIFRNASTFELPLPPQENP